VAVAERFPVIGEDIEPAALNRAADMIEAGSARPGRAF
jgi:hypothetical protein